MVENNTENIAEIENLRREIAKRDLMIKDKAEQLQRIYRAKSWRLLTALVNIKKQLCVFARRIYRFLMVFFLFLITFLYTLYLFLLKKLRKITVFPGG